MTATREALDAPLSAVGHRVDALAQVLELGGEQLEPGAVTAARQVLDRAGERLGRAGDATVVALAGATGSGKSSLFNALAGLEVARVGVRRPTTSSVTACVWGDVPEGLLDWLEVPRRHRTERVSALDADSQAPLAGLVLLDLPDHDSTEVAHRLQVDRLVQLVDLLVWVVDPQKYADAALHTRYLQTLTEHQDVVLVVLNQVDTLPPGGADACESDLRRLLAADGLDEVRTLRTSVRTGEGVAALREVLAGLVQERTAARRRTEADLARAAALLDGDVADGEPDPAAVSGAGELLDALAVAAGVPATADAVRGSWVRAGVARTGWPFTRWVRRLRPDPLKRLRLGTAAGRPGTELEAAGSGTGELEAGEHGSGARALSVRLTRSSLPAPTPAQRAQVAAASRRVAAAAAAQLPLRWADAVRAAAAPAAEDLADGLDQAVQTVPLAHRPPRWWEAVAVLQLVLALAVVAGVVWLAGLALLGWLQLPEPATPDVGASPWRVPVPTLLLAAGAVLGLLVAALARAGVRAGAERRRRAVSAALRAAVDAQVRARLIGAVAAVLDRHRRTREALREVAGSR